MPLLDAALAFAITMLALSTLVTMVSGIFSQLGKTRTDELQKLLREYFETEVQPALATEAARLRGQAEDAIVRVVAAESEQRATELRTFWSDKSGALRRIADDFATSTLEETLQDRTRLKKLTQIGTSELLRAFEDSGPGRELREELGSRADRVLAELGSRWEALGDRYSTLYRNKMRWWSTVIAFALAVILNVDSIHLASTYLTTEETRAAAIARLDVTIERAAAAGSIESRASVDPEAVRLQAIDRNASTDDIRAALHADLRSNIRAARAEADAILASGFPIGWMLYPGCPAVERGMEAGADPRCREIIESTAFREAPEWLQFRLLKILWTDWAHATLWFFGLVATGFLVGLGSPYWYDIVFSLATVAERVRRSPKDRGDEGSNRQASRGGEAEVKSAAAG